MNLAASLVANLAVFASKNIYFSSASGKPEIYGGVTDFPFGFIEHRSPVSVIDDDS